MYVSNTKDCYCHTCEKAFHYLGITRHRAAHRDRYEDCTITFTHGDTATWRYSKNKPVVHNTTIDDSTPLR